jgi:hypothetical protein
MLWQTLVHSPLPDHTLMAKHLKSKDLALIPASLVHQCITISAQRRHLDGLPPSPSFRLTLGLLREAIKQLQYVCPSTHPPMAEEELATWHDVEPNGEPTTLAPLVW